jgi:hypothetical protein
VFSVAFSSDGKTLASASEDHTIGIFRFFQLSITGWSGISLDLNGKYKLELDTLPYELKGMRLEPAAEEALEGNGISLPIRWHRIPPFHWLPDAEAGNKDADEQRQRLLHWLEREENWQTVPKPFRQSLCTAQDEFDLPEKVLRLCELLAS